MCFQQALVTEAASDADLEHTGHGQFPAQGQTFSSLRLEAQHKKTETQLFSLFFPQRKRDSVQRKSLKRGHLNLPHYPLTFPVLSEANGLGGGLSVCTY